MPQTKFRKGIGDMQEDAWTSVFPRLTTTERTAITVDAATRTLNGIAAGYTIYNTTTNKINFWNGTAWEVVTSA